MKRKLLWKKEGALVSVLAVCVLLAACGEEETGTDAGEGSSVSGSVSEEISDADDASGGEGTNIPSGEESAEDFGGDEGADELTVEETVNPYTKPDSLESNEDIENARKYIWQEYLNQVRNDAARMEEVENRAMTFGEATMKYGAFVLGEPDELGYPLFIALHGGGQSDTPDLNDSQWVQMTSYYQNSVENGNEDGA